MPSNDQTKIIWFHVDSGLIMVLIELSKQYIYLQGRPQDFSQGGGGRDFFMNKTFKGIKKKNQNSRKKEQNARKKGKQN